MCPIRSFRSSTNGNREPHLRQILPRCLRPSNLPHLQRGSAADPKMLSQNRPVSLGFQCLLSSVSPTFTSPLDQERIVSGEAIENARLAIEDLGGRLVGFGIVAAGWMIPMDIPKLNAIRGHKSPADNGTSPAQSWHRPDHKARSPKIYLLGSLPRSTQSPSRTL